MSNNNGNNNVKPVLIIVMGASGCGKSSIGLAIAQIIKSPFIDADDLHPSKNVEKMANGTPLNDQDRIPWLNKIGNSALILTTTKIGVKKLNELNSNLTATTTTTATTELTLNDKSKELEIEQVIEKIHPASLYPPTSNQLIGELGSSITSSKEEEGEELNEVNAVKRRTAVVIACSALKVSYRDILRGIESNNEEGENLLDTYFIYLHGTKPLLLNRMKNRPGHFMKSDMLDSQLNTLEIPIEQGSNKELGVHRINLGKGLEDSEERGIEAVVKDASEIAKRLIGGVVLN